MIKLGLADMQSHSISFGRRAIVLGQEPRRTSLGIGGCLWELDTVVQVTKHLVVYVGVAIRRIKATPPIVSLG